MNEDSQFGRVTPVDEGDDHGALSRLLRDAQPGAVIKLEARTYTLNKPLVIGRPVTLAGVGRERSRLLGQGDHPVVVVSSNVKVALRDVTIGARRPGSNDADGTLVVCSLGRVQMTRCRVYGATGKGRGAGAGVRVERSARLRAEDCVFAGNAAAGVVVLESAHAWIQGSAFEGNGLGLVLEERAEVSLEGCALVEQRGDAVRASGRARLTAEANRCEDNRGAGVAASGRVEVTLRRNSCLGNTRDGIALTDAASGVLADNSCLDNGGSGIVLATSGRVEVTSNTLSFNRRCGVRLGAEADARLWLNACRRNNREGIASASAAAPEIVENVCEDNRGHGIVLRGEATGEVRANSCMNNGRAGLCLMHRAAATLTYNSCAHNQAGILLKGAASGLVELNTCYGNSAHSIKIDPEATPEVRSNTFQGLVVGRVRVEGATALAPPVAKWRRVPVRSPRQLDARPGWGAYSPRLRLAIGIVAGAALVVGWAALLFPVIAASAALLVGLGASLLGWERALRARQQRLMTHGAWALGEVTGIRRDGSLMLCTWTASDGQQRTLEGAARSAAVAAEHNLGEQVAVLYDPVRPERAVVPSLLGASFVLPPAAADERPERPGAPQAPPSPLGDEERLFIDLLDAPRPTDHVCWLSWLWSAHRPVVVIGRLSVTATRLSLLGSDRRARAELDLTQPLSVSLSAWLVSGDRAELTVELRQRGAGAEAPAVHFKVELPQSLLSAQIPLQQSHGPYIDPVRFARLWAALRFNARAVGDDPLEGLVGEVTPLLEAGR